MALIGLSTILGSKEDKGGKKKHDFFFIPVIIWGGFFFVLSIWFLFFIEVVPKKEIVSDQPVRKPITRFVNFYNPSEDTLTYIVADETGDGLIERNKVLPGQLVRRELPMKTYLFNAFNSKSENTLQLPSKEDATDTLKYILFEDDKGKFYQRILYPETIEENDYDDAWLILDGKTKLVLLDITDLQNGELNKEEVNEYKWSDNVYEVYKPKDLVEPLYGESFEGKEIEVIPPGRKLPPKTTAEVSFALVPYTVGDMDDAFFAKYLNKINN